MTKRLIKTDLDIDWISSIEDKSKGDALKWIQDNIPEGAILEIYYGYDFKNGETYIHREETDEEYAARLVKEQAELDEQEAKSIQQAYLLQNKISILKGQDLALATYLQKHKDNPRIGDLENLFLAIAQANMHGAKGAFIQQLQDCMVDLEGD